MIKSLSLLFISLFLANQAQAALVVYSDRAAARLQPAAQKFESLTGQKVLIVESPYNDLSARLAAEGKDSPADLLLTKDLVYLNDAVQKKLLQPMRLSPAVQSVRSAMRDSGNHWVAVTFRARTLAFDPSRVNPTEISSYEDLAKDKWAGRLCLRTSSSAYNEALVSYFFATKGEAATSNLLRGWVENLAAPVFPNDTALLEAIASGTCDVGIVNHYYLAALHAKNPNFPVKIRFLEQSGKGVHVNGTGIGIVKTSKNTELAQKFIELLLSEEFQLQFSAAHFDYPAVEGLLPSSLIRSWGAFKLDSTSWTQVGGFLPKAKNLAKEVGYN